MNSFFEKIFLGNPCLTRNPCLNSGTCFGQYNASGSVYTQCFCLQGYSGAYCEGNRMKQKKIVMRSFLFNL